MIKKANIYENLPNKLKDEFFEGLLNYEHFKLERIISKGHSTPQGEWYDQERDEWVVLLKGSAALIIEGEEKEIILKPGDHLVLPAHLKHRVAWTDPHNETFWLALHFK